MSDSTPLPEQGGFNEKLEEILDDFGNQAVNGVNKYNLNFKTRAAIRTLVLEEIIGEAEQYIDHRNSTTDRLKGWNDGISCVVREQRKKLEDTHGTK